MEEVDALRVFGVSAETPLSEIEAIFDKRVGELRKMSKTTKDHRTLTQLGRELKELEEARDTLRARPQNEQPPPPPPLIEPIPPPIAPAVTPTGGQVPPPPTPRLKIVFTQVRTWITQNKKLAIPGAILLFVAVGAIAFFWSRAPSPISLENATKEHPWENSLGMKFVPIAERQVWFSIWDTRVGDFSEFVDNAPGDYSYKATNGMWLLDKGVWNESQGASWKEPGFKQDTTNPVVGVSWDDAKAFCDWLTRKEHAAGRLPQRMIYRLPTDEEWSAAVGLSNESGTTRKEKDGKITGINPWGEQSPAQSTPGNYADSGTEWSGKSTSPVGKFSANRYGLCDMGGNVWQWCEDPYDIKPTACVLRGASWCHDKPDDLLSSRASHEPTYRSADIGFRCVVAPASPQ